MPRLLLILSAVFTLHSPFFILNSAAQVAYKLPDSGQAKCYRAVAPYDEIDCDSTGQDGAYNINPMSFTDNVNGTVTDNNTGLVWQKCSVGRNNDDTCGGTATTYNWYQATGTYDATYNTSSQSVCDELILGGTADWRLPSKKELMSIVDYSIPFPGPTIQQTWFPGTDAFKYWSSTADAGNTGIAWNVNFDNGSVFNFVKFRDYNVRCVRDGH